MTPGLAAIDINIDPVLRIGGLGIHWYGLMYAVAFGVGLYVGVIPHLEKRGIDRQTAERYTVWAIVFGLIGARLYYVVQSSPPQGGSWFSHPEEILAVWHGGMAFFGAMIAAPLTAAVLAWREKHNWWLIADAAAVFAVLGQPIGRIGNVINGDILGHESTLPWAVTYSNPNAILQSGFVNCSLSTQLGEACHAYQPAAVYEALGTLAILAVVFTLRARLNPRAGMLWIVYLALYAVSQILIFFARGSEPVVGLGLKQAQWTAIVVLVVAVPLTIAAWRRNLLNWAPEGRETGEYMAPPELPAAEPATPSAAVGQEAPAAEGMTGSRQAGDDDGPEEDVIPGTGAAISAQERREQRRRERKERARRLREAAAAGHGAEEAIAPTGEAAELRPRAEPAGRAGHAGDDEDGSAHRDDLPAEAGATHDEPPVASSARHEEEPDDEPGEADSAAEAGVAADASPRTTAVTTGDSTAARVRSRSRGSRGRRR